MPSKNFLESNGISFSCKKLDFPAQRFQGWNQDIVPKFKALTLEALKKDPNIYQYPLHPVFISAKKDDQRGAHRHDKIVQTIIEEESKKELATFKDQLFKLFKEIAKKNLEKDESLLKAIAIRLHPVLSTVNTIKQFTIDDLKLSPEGPAHEAKSKSTFNSFLDACHAKYRELTEEKLYTHPKYESIMLEKPLPKTTSTSSLVAFAPLAEQDSTKMFADFPIPKILNKRALSQAETINGQMKVFFRLDASDIEKLTDRAAAVEKDLAKGYEKFITGNYPLLITLMDGILKETEEEGHYKSKDIAYDTTVWLMVTYIIDDIAEKLAPDGVDKLYTSAINLLKSKDEDKEAQKSELKESVGI